jgi:hypothetical protein
VVDAVAAFVADWEPPPSTVALEVAGSA